MGASGTVTYYGSKESRYRTILVVYTAFQRMTKHGDVTLCKRWVEPMRIERPVTLPTQRKNVVSYSDDIFAWAYLDQEDGLIRYEAYVVGYSERGEPTTLEFVFEEGAFDLHDFPVVHNIWLDADGSPLTASDWQSLHDLFAAEEEQLKRTNRSRWTHRLRALGYDVIGRR